MLSRFLDATRRAGLARDGVLLGSRLRQDDEARLLDLAVAVTEGQHPGAALLLLDGFLPEVAGTARARFALTRDSAPALARWLLAVAMGAGALAQDEMSAAA
jgi:hypothetical protein